MSDTRRYSGRRVRARFLLPFLSALTLTSLAGQASAGTTALPRFGPTGQWLRQDTPLGASYLQVPAGCSVRLCPLVVVSHPRGQTAERMRDSVQVNGLIAPLLAANFAVLLGGDGGPTGWGSPGALGEVAQAHSAAVRAFPWNGRTYALGISMGGLLALRSALPGAPYAVSGVALIDAWVDLSAAWGSALSRRGEIEAAYSVTGAPGSEFDPLFLTLLSPPLPLFIASSPDDTTVSAARNSARLSPHADPALSEVIPLRGEHLGANRFTPAMAERLIAFLKRLEGPLTRR